MRIRNLFLIGLCIVAAPGVVMSVRTAVSTGSTWTKANEAIVAMRAVSDAQRAQTEIAYEVGKLGSLLLIDGVDQASVAKDAAATNKAMEAAARSAEAAGLSADATRSVMSSLVDLRSKLSIAFAQAAATRDSALAKATAEVRTVAVEKISRLATTAAAKVANAAPALGSYVELAGQVMDLRDHVGRRNGLLVLWISGVAVEPQAYDTAVNFGGRAEQEWSTIKRLIAVSEDPVLVEGLKHQRDTYEAQSEPHWRQGMAFARAKLNGTASPWTESVSQWRAWATPAQAELLLLRDVSLDRSLSRAEADLASALLGFAIAVGLALVSLALAIGGLLLLLRRIVSPVRLLTEVIGRTAQGDLAVEVPCRGGNDEISQMADAIEVLRIESLERRRMESTIKREEKVVRASQLETLVRAFEVKVASLVSTLAGASAKMQSTAHAMAATAGETSRQAAAVTSASRQASSSVQTVAAATEELSASVTEIGQQASTSRDIARQAIDRSTETRQTVDELVVAADRIGEAVKLISTIAAQTNLLALNATIESARAGDAGKGFSVVASEVKNLATQTAKATDEIQAQVAAIQSSTHRTVTAIGTIDGIIAQMSEISIAIASAVEEQTSATLEIARSVQVAAKGTEEVSGNIAGVNEASATTGDAANHILSAAQELSVQAEDLNQEVGRFIASVQAA